MNVLAASSILLPSGRVAPATVAIDDRVITAVTVGETLRQVRQRLPRAQVVAVRGLLTPGFIDLHTHGFCGHDLSTGEVADILAMADALPQTGVTAFLPTLSSASPDETLRQVGRIREAAERQRTGATILGIRLEGPYLSPEKRGAQSPAALRPPSLEEFDRLVSAAATWIKMIDVAPELPGAYDLIRRACSLRVQPCIGHTAATAEIADLAVRAGATHCTHLFNAMPPLHHRHPGPVAVLLGSPTTTVEIIADGVHLHPATLTMAARAKGPRRCALVTDACPAAGLSDGDYVVAGRSVLVRDGSARLSDGTLAGSTLTLDRALRTLHEGTTIPLTWMLRMAAAAPAFILRDHTRGRLVPGARADIVELDETLHVRRVWLGGNELPVS
jgi:N-acetylglucosamine-6-phosphate deacetylase